MLRQPPLWQCLLLVAAVALVAPIARGGDDPGREPHVVRSVFFVAKSENKNQVHYGISLDDACVPAGDAPVFAYWRMLEHGPLATEPLLAREIPAYGLAEQRRPKPSAKKGGTVALTLNALPKRPIVIESTPVGRDCATTATVTIDGRPASLTNVFVQLRWPFGVEYMMISGRASLDGHTVHERVAQ